MPSTATLKTAAKAALIATLILSIPSLAGEETNYDIAPPLLCKCIPKIHCTTFIDQSLDFSTIECKPVEQNDLYASWICSANIFFSSADDPTIVSNFFSKYSKCMKNSKCIIDYSMQIETAHWTKTSVALITQIIRMDY